MVLLGGNMFFIYTGMTILYLALIFMIWQMGKLVKENRVLVLDIQNQEQQIANQEAHLKQTLQIMQDLAKKMHVQQEVLDNHVHRLAQLEFQNAELVKLLQKNNAP